ncbi:MAG: tripartite tricarboxylate transporter permease [Acidobacteria bacterium]|nr:tripartite tricarboxylate transporter permease [Acidobacteriota bacterium]
MIDIVHNLFIGFAGCLQPANLILLVAGTFTGLLVGVLPGLTLVMGVLLALPFTYSMDVTPAIILLTSMYVSGTYGGAFTAILFRIPGEPIHVPFLWDGFAMARQGQAAKALGWTLYAALFGGLLSAVIMILLSQPLATVALTFSTPEYFAIVLFGLTSVVSLGGGSMSNAFISLFAGLLLSTVGVDPTYGAPRFTFGKPIFMNGIEFLTVIVGCYGIGELLTRIQGESNTAPVRASGFVKTSLPGRKEIQRLKVSILRSSILGHVLGIVPGAGATIASFVAYGIEQRFGRMREKLNTGIPEGIVAPQAAATASVGGAMIPLLTLGVPGSGATAVILGALLLHGIQPGPQVFATSTNMIYTVFASLFLGIILMCIFGYFAIRPLVKILDFPESVISVYIMILCFIGAFSIRSSISDLWLMIAFGAVGYLFNRFRFPIAPLVLGAILGPLAETSFMTTMISFQNDWTIFFRRPISGTLMVLTIGTFLIQMIKTRPKSKHSEWE